MKKIVRVLAVVICMLSLFGCSMGEEGVTQQGSSSSMVATIIEESVQSNSSDTITFPEESEYVNPQIDDAIYLDAMEKWKKIGGCTTFNSVTDLDTLTLVELHSSYSLYNQIVQETQYNEWLPISEFDQFAKDYFNLEAEIFHQDYLEYEPTKLGGFDETKGFFADNRAGVLPIDAKYTLTNRGYLNDDLYFFDASISFEPVQGLGDEDITEIVRNIHIEFNYIDNVVYFVSASYE